MNSELEAKGPVGRLTGSLWEPTGPARGVVLLQPGHGPADRTDDGFFDDHIAALNAAGFAAAAFDKRGVGGSSGDWTVAGIDDQAADAAAAASAVRAAFPHVPLHLFGHSQGGWVVYAARALVGPLTISTTSTAPVAPAEQQTHATRMTLLRAGWPEGEAEAGADVVADQFVCAIAGLPELPTIPEDLLTRLRGEHVFLIEDDASRRLVAALGRYEPHPDLHAIDRPLFASYGGADTSVPVDRSVQILRAHVPAEWLTLQVIDGADHTLRTDESSPLFLDAWLSFLETNDSIK